MEKVYLKPEDIAPLFGIGRTTAYAWLKENKFDIAYEKKSGKRRIVFSQEVYREILNNSEIDPELNMKFLKESEQDSEQFIEKYEQNTIHSEIVQEIPRTDFGSTEYSSYVPNNVQIPISNNIDANTLVQDLIQKVERLSKEAGRAENVPLLTDSLFREQKDNKELNYKYADLLQQFNTVQIELNTVRSELNSEKAKNQTLIEENQKLKQKQTWWKFTK